MPEMTTIWIVNEAGHDYEKAKEIVHGDCELKPLTLGDTNPLRTDRTSWHLAQGIAKYVKPDDFLLISGTPMINALALSMWLIQWGSVKVLQWNAKQREYELSTVNFDNLSNLLDKEMVRD